MQPSSFSHRIVNAGSESVTSNNTTRVVVIVSALAVITGVGLYLSRRLQQEPTQLAPSPPPRKPPILTPSPRVCTEEATIADSAIREANTNSTLTDDKCFSSKDLSIEKAAITEKMESLPDLVAYIKAKHGFHQREGFAALFVILGIKPVAIFERGFGGRGLHKILENYLTDERPQYTLESFQFKKQTSYCFINKSPFENFNPRLFLDPLQTSESSLNEMTIHCFLNQGKQETDQMLSYLLGYGPSFEAYNQRVGHDFDPSKSIFSDAHYEQIGHVFAKENSIEVGVYIHKWMSEQPPTPMMDDKLNIRNPDSPFVDRTDLELERIIYSTGTKCAYSGISARTEYSQDSLSLKKWVLEKYFPKTYNDRIK